MARWSRAAVVFVLTAALCAAASRFTAAYLRIGPDLAAAYPPSGIGVAAVYLFGGPAAAGVFAGSLASAWTNQTVAEAGYAAANTFECSLAWVVFTILRRRGWLRRRDLDLRTARARLLFLATAVSGNTGLAAFAGNLIGHLAGGAAGGNLLRDTVTWWVGDASAVLMLGWPLLEARTGLDRWRRVRRAAVRHPDLIRETRRHLDLSAPARLAATTILGFWVVFQVVLRLAEIEVPGGGALLAIPVVVAAYVFGFRGGLVAGSVLGWWAIGRVVAGGVASTEVVVATALAAFDRAAVGLVVGGLFEARRRQVAKLRRQYTSLEHDLAYVAGVLTAAVESRDPYTEGHMQRVSNYAVRIARRLGMADDEVETIRLAALLHDVGKIGVPDRILFKPEPLDGDDLAQMRSHVEIGARIAEHASALRAAVPVIRSHQERYDGRTEGPFPGYPDGLKGDAIPFHARIVSVADAYDTMTTNRPYRKALGRERALEILREERGRQFDPRVVDAFLADMEARRARKPSDVFSISALLPAAGGKR